MFLKNFTAWRRLRSKLVAMLLSCIVVSLSFSACVGPGREVDFQIPWEGVYYCEEIEVTLTLDKENGIRKPSILVVNGNEITCVCGIEPSTAEILLICKEEDAEGYEFGKTIYRWAIIDCTENEMILEDSENDQQFRFLRIE